VRRPVINWRGIWLLLASSALAFVVLAATGSLVATGITFVLAVFVSAAVDSFYRYRSGERPPRMRLRVRGY
jgi:hypothetical protein